MPKPKVTEDQIRETAYHMWMEDGAPHGDDQSYWYKAEDALTTTPTKKAPARKTTTRKPAAKATAAAKPAAKKAPAKKAAPAKGKAKS